MKSRIAAVAVGAAALFWAMAPGAIASSIASPIQIDRSGSIVGGETSIGRIHAATVRMKLLSPRGVDGTREVWDRCVLPHVGPGQYRCEFNIGSATAYQRSGEWLVRLRLDDHTVAHKLFHLP